MSRTNVIVPLDFGSGMTGTMTVTDLLTPADRMCLAGLATDAAVAYDVGAFTGCSSEAILCGMKPDGACYAVDTYCGSGGDYPSEMQRTLALSIWATRLKRFGSRARLYVGQSVEFAGMQKRDSADLVFLDAAHSFPAVMADIDAWAPVLKSGGILAGHDFDKRMVKCPANVLLEHRDKEVVGIGFHVGEDGGELIHLGVVAAVKESFPGVYLADDPDSTIWWVVKP